MRPSPSSSRSGRGCYAQWCCCGGRVMAVPERKGRSSAWLGAGVVVALLAVAALVACVVVVDGRRRQQLTELEERLDTLGRLVDDVQRQLDRHVNASVHSKSSAPQQEIVYEDEYEYDDGEGSYEYDDEDGDEDNHKSTVKRAPGLNESNSTKTEDTTRSKRDIPTVREERYVPTNPLMNNIEYSKNKHGMLRMYASYFGNPMKYVGSSNQTRHLSNSNPEVLLETDGETHEKKSSHHQPHHHKTPVYQEQRRPEESIVRLRHGGRSRSGHKADVELLSENSREEFDPQNPSVQQCDILAAHYVADASSYNVRDHSHYYGNNILFHPYGIFKDWAPADWMFDLGSNSRFTIHHGKLSVQKPGIYFVYAQIYYAATHDRCGFHIKHNGVEVAQCMITSYGRMAKRNTCFTAVVLQLQSSDLLWTSEVEGHRNTSFKSSHSFFGLILLKPV